MTDHDDSSTAHAKRRHNRPAPQAPRKLLPHYMTVPRNLRRLAKAWLKTGEMETAMLMVGYKPLRDTAQETERAKRVEKSKGFQKALRSAMVSHAIETLYRVSETEKGSAALTAIDKLMKLVDNYLKGKDVSKGVSLSETPVDKMSKSVTNCQKPIWGSSPGKSGHKENTNNSE